MINRHASFDMVNNNCWHEVKRQYQAYWGHDCPVDVDKEQPDNLMHLHRGALRLAAHFGVAKVPEDGCIVLLSKKNLIHHFGFFNDGIITSLCQAGLYKEPIKNVLEKGFNIKFLNVKSGANNV